MSNGEGQLQTEEVKYWVGGRFKDIEEFPLFDKKGGISDFSIMYILLKFSFGVFLQMTVGQVRI